MDSVIWSVIILERVEIERIDGIEMYVLRPEEGKILVMSFDMDKVDLCTVRELYDRINLQTAESFKNKMIVIPQGIELDVESKGYLKQMIEELEKL